jgi:[acyl-carrier-protein] S-malonyltransferase
LIFKVPAAEMLPGLCLFCYFCHKQIQIMKAYVFPGQGAQFSGMGKDLYEASDVARSMFQKANEILGFDIQKIMFEGTDEELKQTKVTQPAIFLHSTILAACLGDSFKPGMVAGHSLGEISALVANQTLSFEDGLRLVYKRALAMQAACEAVPSTMAAILGLEDEVVEQICEQVDGIVVAANYNCPGQLVISGSIPAVEEACAKLTEAGAKRALILPVGGAFHSPLMEPAREELAKAIEGTTFNTPSCAVYQNTNAKAVTDPSEIKKNLIEQLTAPVRWTQIMNNMISDGATEVIEVGPGKVLQGLFKKVDRAFPCSSAELISA